MSSWIFWIFSFFTIQEYNIFPFFLVCQEDKMRQEHYVNWVLHLAYIILNLRQCVSLPFSIFIIPVHIFFSQCKCRYHLVGGWRWSRWWFRYPLRPKTAHFANFLSRPMPKPFDFLKGWEIVAVFLFCFVFFLIHLNLF